MDVRPALVADRETAVLAQPRQGALDESLFAMLETLEETTAS